MKGYIYQIENLVNHKSYIGQTVDFNRRKRTHINQLRTQKHDNIKLQNAWNKYGEQEFHFRVWEFEIKDLEELNVLECEYIEKFDSINNGYNLIPGGGKPPLHKKVKNKDIITFLCIQQKYGDGYGKTCEEIFGWSKGTASAAKTKKRYIEAIQLFEQLSDKEREERATIFFNEVNLEQRRINRQLTQGGCNKAYTLTQDDFNFAFTAKELGYGYTAVANYIGVKPATVKDWFNGRSRKKERENYDSLSNKDKNQLISRVKIAELSGKPKSVSSI